MNDFVFLFHKDLHEDDHQLALLGDSTAVECSSSQERTTMDANMNKIFDHHSTYYRKALSLFEEMVNSCPNKYLFIIVTTH